MRKQQVDGSKRETREENLLKRKNVRKYFRRLALNEEEKKISEATAE